MSVFLERNFRINDVFNVEESSELLRASSNRHAAPTSALRSIFTIRSFLRVLSTWPYRAAGPKTLRTP